jgi:hypothetical protein
MTAEKAEYSVLPGGVYATVTLNLRIQNRSDEPAQLLLCAFDIERDTGAGFVNMPWYACQAASPGTGGPRIAAHGEESLTLLRTLEMQLIDENTMYRMATAVSFGPDFKHGKPYKSIPFSLVRSK